MSNAIPEGFAFIEGRDPEVAKALFDAAEKAGVDVYDVRTDSRGYIFPDSLVEHYEAPEGTPDAEVGEAVEAEAEVESDGKQPADDEARAAAARNGVATPDPDPVTSDAKVESEVVDPAVTTPDAGGTPAGGEATAETGAENAGAVDGSVEEPKKSGSTAAWVEFAQTKGYDESEGLSRDELVARYGTPAE